jgi:hypothetical protein
MNHEPAPRLSKPVFLAIDAGLLVTAFVIVFFAQDPYAPLPFVSAVLCVALAALIGLVPFLTDYAAEQAEAARRLQEHTEGQIGRLTAAGDSLARAAAQIKAVEEAVHKSAREAETLPYRMQEKLAEFNEALASQENEDREALERELDELRAANSDQLKAVADRIAKAAADWTALEIATRKQLTAAEAALARLQAGHTEFSAKLDQQTAATLAALDAKIADLKQVIAQAKQEVVAAAPVPPPAPASPVPVPPAAEPTPSPSLETPVEAAAPVEPTPAEPASVVAEPEPFEEAPKARKPRAPRKPRTEETPLTEPSPAATPEPTTPTIAPAVELEPSPEPAPSTPEPEHEAEAPAPLFAAEPPAEAPAKAETSTSSDGATRLLATAYIGIGNKLYIRGEGPGLSWDKGVPMQFVSIGKWGWHSHEATAPLRVKLYKNDDTPCMTGEVQLEPGRHTEVTALF